MKAKKLHNSAAETNSPPLPQHISSYARETVPNNTEVQHSVSAVTEESAAREMLRLDCLDDSCLERYAENYRLVTLVEGGLTVGEAIKQTGTKLKKRAIYYLVERFRAYGKAGLIDKRWQRKTETKILTPEVTEVILAWFFARPAAGFRAIAELSMETCRERNLPVPSESTVKRFLVKQAEGVKLARKGSLGFKQWKQRGASVVSQNKTTFSNELWQGDHTPPEIWIRKKINGSWEPFNVHLSAFLDDFSRAIPGFTVSTKFSDSWSIAILSRFSMMKKEIAGWNVSGLPFNIESDCGADWIGEAVQTSWQSLGITPVIDHPYYPNSKGKVERWFRTLDSNCLRKLPGHFDAIGRTLGAARKHVHELLTLEQLRAEITKWIVNVYHQKVHSETGRKPIELWEESVRYRPVKNEDELNILLLKYDKERTVLNSGIRLTINGERHRYWAPNFDRLWHRHVRIRYNPEDLESVLLYCADSGEFLCEAWDMRSANARYSYQDVKDSRKTEKGYLQGIQKRLPQYFKGTQETDRVIEQQKEWAESRAVAEKLPLPAETTNIDEDVDDLINTFRRRDRRKTKELH